MLKAGSFLFTMCIFCDGAFTQNMPPVLSNVSALADTIFHRLTVTFDVSDAENDTLEVLFSASADSGTYYNLNTSEAWGDIGFPVTAGSGKRIYWHYPDSLSGMIPAFVIKLAADDRAVDIQQVVSRIDSNRLKQDLRFIEGIRHHGTGAVHLREVRDSLLARFQRFGLQTRLHEFPFGTFTGQNVIGRKTGLVSNTKTFILDGHYDTVNDSPGADDNGSAIAGILEALRVMATLDLAYSVEFIAFDLEEAGLAGSKAFVANGIMDDEDIAGVINMDMIGYFSNAPNSQTLPAGFELLFPELYSRLADNDFRGNFIISTADHNSRSLLTLFDSMAARHAPSLLVGSVLLPEGIVIEDARRSDHAPFWDAGYRALHLSDGAETRNPNYHAPADVAATLNYTFMSEVTMAATATLLSLAKPLHADIRTVQVAPDPSSAAWETVNDGCIILLKPASANGHFIISTHHCSNEPVRLRVMSLEGKVMGLYRLFAAAETEIELGRAIQPGYYVFEFIASEASYSRKVYLR